MFMDMNCVFERSCFFRRVTKIVVSGLFLGLVACGDDVNKVNGDNGADEELFVKILESGELLYDQPCKSQNAGEIVYLTDSAKVYVCDGENWQLQNAVENVKTEIESISKDTFYVHDTVFREDTVEINRLDTVIQQDSVVIYDTIYGLDGKNCVTEPIDAGYKIVCGGDSVGVLINGQDGNDGENCKIASEKNAIVTIVCGVGESADTTQLYKAVCGGKEYNPEDGFCFNQVYYDKCGEEVYWPSSQFCDNREVYDMCGGKIYRPSNQFCDNHIVYDYCDGSKYDPKTQYCEYDEIAEYQCNGKIYDSRTHYCVGDRIEPNPQCNGISYFPGLYYCKNAKDITPFGYVTASRKNKKLYKTIEIGEGDETQVWVAENIDVPDSPKETNLCNDKLLGVGGSRPIPFDTLPSCFVFGSLYDFSNAVADENCKGFMQCINTVPDQGLCPIGFHLPDTTEWKKLFLTAEKYAKELKGGDVDVKDVSRMLRSTHGWNYENGTNSFGLDVYPTGYSVSEDWVIGFLNTVYYWTATEVDEAHTLDTEYGEAHVAYFDYQEYRVLRSMKTAEVAIRCVKD